MAVVTGAGAEELDLFFPAPGTDTVQQAMGIGPGNHIKHHIQAGCAANKDLLRLAAQNIRPIFPAAGQAGQLTVVAGIQAVNDAIVPILQHGKNVAYHIKLQLGRLASSHIQLKALGLAAFKMLKLRSVQLLQLSCVFARISVHSIILPSEKPLDFRILYVNIRKNAI